MFKYSPMTRSVTNVTFESFATCAPSRCNNGNDSVLEASVVSVILAAEVGTASFRGVEAYGEDVHLSGGGSVSVVRRDRKG